MVMSRQWPQHRSFPWRRLHRQVLDLNIKSADGPHSNDTAHTKVARPLLTMRCYLLMWLILCDVLYPHVQTVEEAAVASQLNKVDWSLRCFSG